MKSLRSKKQGNKILNRFIVMWDSCYGEVFDTREEAEDRVEQLLGDDIDQDDITVFEVSKSYGVQQQGIQLIEE